MITTRRDVIYNGETQDEILKEIELLVKSKIDILEENKVISLKFKVEIIE